MKRRRIVYSAVEMDWLEANRLMILSDYHRAFCAAFGRTDVTAEHLHSLRTRKGWKVGRAPGRFAGRSWRYSAEEIAWLKANCTMVLGNYQRVFCELFERDDITIDHLKALRTRRKWKTGRTGRFEKGVVPLNKGKPCPPGKGGRHPNARKTQFKKGNKPHTYRGPGHESIDEDGYVWIIVAETNPHTGAATHRVMKHKYLWEQVNGPVPDGMALKCLDGVKTNTNPDNWEAIPRALLPRLNGIRGRGYDTAPAELKPTILAVTKLEHAARSKAEDGSK